MVDIELSERQKKTIGAALTLLSGGVIVAFIGLLIWCLVWSVNRFSAVFLPLAVAAVLALMLKPWHAWIMRRIGQRPIRAVFLLYLAIGLPLALFLFFFGTRILSEVSGLVRQAPIWWESAMEGVHTHLPAAKEFWGKHGLGEKFGTLLDQNSAAFFRGVGGFGGWLVQVWSTVFGWVTGLFGWAVLPIYLAFFLIAEKPVSKEQIVELLPFLKEETREDALYLGEEFVNILVAFFRGQLVVALLQGVLYAVGFSLVGLQYGFTLGILLGFLNIVPYLGSMIGLGLCLPLALFQSEGGWMLMLIVLGVFTLVQTIEGYLLTPRIMGQRTGLHPLVIMVAIFFWATAFGGITGMILAIPLTAFLVIFWRLAKTKYIKALV